MKVYQIALLFIISLCPCMRPIRANYDYNKAYATYSNNPTYRKGMYNRGYMNQPTPEVNTQTYGTSYGSYNY